MGINEKMDSATISLIWDFIWDKVRENYNINGLQIIDIKRAIEKLSHPIFSHFCLLVYSKSFQI